MNTFTSSRPTLWLKSSRNCSGGWRGLVGGFSYYIKIFCQIYFIKIYIWKRGKPKSATHRRMLMPIWFHSLIILPGSAAGAAALKYSYIFLYIPGILGADRWCGNWLPHATAFPTRTRCRWAMIHGSVLFKPRKPRLSPLLRAGRFQIFTLKQRWCECRKIMI